jgi:lipoprotein-anchoring transpeptidase ErfK/SrfK
MAKVEPHPSAGAPPDSIVVDTYEQTMGVYRGGHLVMATLISSGSRYFPTRTGTFHVWTKFTHGRMTGAYFADRRDYYFIEDVPWILYYDGDRALHGAYWHDRFGAKSSHGCVNLSPYDARWLYNNIAVGEVVVVFASQ